MNKKTTILVTLLIVLSIFTYIKLDELKNSKEYSNILLAEIENNEKEQDEIHMKLDAKEKEFEKLKLQYKSEYESRNIIDMKARKIYDSFINRDIEYLKNEVSNGVKVENDKITFENGYIFTLTERYDDDFVLRQRHYYLNEEKTKFTTGYEVLLNNVEFVPVYNFEFINQNGEWKLNNLYEE